MALQDIKTSRNELQEYLLLLNELPEKINKIEIDIRKELLIDIDKRIKNISITICGMIENCSDKHYPENIEPDKLFEYWALKVSQLFTYYELKNLELLIENSFEKSVKPEILKENDLPKNPYPLIFISYEVYKCFETYIDRKHIISFYTDYSYLKKRLFAEKLIYNITDTDFLNFLFDDLKIISEKNKDEYIDRDGKFRSDCYSVNRQNNFNEVFEEVLNKTP